MGVVSVVIPVHSRLQYLPETLFSVLNQTRPPDEVVLVADGIADDLTSYIEQGVRLMPDQASAAESARRVRVLRLPQSGGPSAARNAGVREAKGSLIAFQDSDDLWYPDTLARLEAHLLNHAEDAAVCGSMLSFNEHGEEYPFMNDRPAHPALADALRRNCIAIQTLMIRREAYEAVQGFDTSLRFGEDHEFSIRILLSGKRLRFLSDPPLIRYRRHDEGISRNWMRALRCETSILWRYQAAYRRELGPGARRAQLAWNLMFCARKARGWPGRILKGASLLIQAVTPRAALRWFPR